MEYSTTLHCPECTAAGLAPLFDSPLSLGRHRHLAHGYRNPNSKYKSKRKAKAEAAAAEAQAQATKPPTPDQQTKAQEIPAQFLGYCVGKLEALAENLARENGFAVKPFTRQIAAYFNAVQQ